MRKKIKKSTWLSLALFIYISVMAFYFLPRNTMISDTEKWITLVASYVIVVALWLVLRRKERIQEQRRAEDRLKKLKDKEQQ